LCLCRADASWIIRLCDPTLLPAKASGGSERIIAGSLLPALPFVAIHPTDGSGPIRRFGGATLPQLHFNSASRCCGWHDGDDSPDSGSPAADIAGGFVSLRLPIHPLIQTS
jgi:hypothetical protein